LTQAISLVGITSIVLHGIELSEDEVKVTVEEVLMSFALVLMPTNEVYIVA